MVSPPIKKKPHKTTTDIQIRQIRTGDKVFILSDPDHAVAQEGFRQLRPALPLSVGEDLAVGEDLGAVGAARNPQVAGRGQTGLGVRPETDISKESGMK